MLCGGIFLYESCENGKVVIVPHSSSLRDVLKGYFTVFTYICILYWLCLVIVHKGR